VNATAHGLSAVTPSGFCISGSSVPQLNVCGVVSTATTNSFTFLMIGAPACASSCGTVLPAKRTIWLRTDTISGGYNVSFLEWVVTTSPAGGKTSAWSGASAAENAAVSAGTFIEYQKSQIFTNGTTLAQAETWLANDWASTQASQTSSVQPGTFTGNFWDGVGWLQ
jgi:hypothetical protein